MNIRHEGGLAALAIVALALPLDAGAQFTAEQFDHLDRRHNLVGIKAVWVSASFTVDDDTLQQSAERELREIVKTRLSQHGLAVEMRDILKRQPPGTGVLPFLDVGGVAVRSGGVYAYSVRLLVDDAVIVLRSNHKTRVPVWQSADLVGTTMNLQDTLRARTGELLDAFLKDWLAANPRDSDPKARH